MIRLVQLIHPEHGRRVAVVEEARLRLIADAESEADGWSRFVREEMLDQPTAAVAMPAGEDAYLVELRKAMLDESVHDGVQAILHQMRAEDEHDAGVALPCRTNLHRTIS